MSVFIPTLSPVLPKSPGVSVKDIVCPPIRYSWQPYWYLVRKTQNKNTCYTNYMTHIKNTCYTKYMT